MPSGNLKLTLISTDRDFDLLDVFMVGQIQADDLTVADVPRPPNPSKGILITGRGTVWVYGYLSVAFRDASWIALHAAAGAEAVVVKSDGRRMVGDTIAFDVFKQFIPHHEPIAKKEDENAQDENRVVAFLGPPHSGKSVLLNALRLKLREQLLPEQFQRGFYILRACPDGEGDWFSEIPAEQAMLLRYKGAFDDYFVETVCKQLESLKKQKELVFVDCGGKIDKKNQKIWNLCTHAISVSSDPNAFCEWRGAAAASELRILAEVESVREETSEVISDGSPLRLRIGKLERSGCSVEVPAVLLDRLISPSVHNV